MHFIRHFKYIMSMDSSLQERCLFSHMMSYVLCTVIFKLASMDGKSGPYFLGSCVLCTIYYFPWLRERSHEQRVYRHVNGGARPPRPGAPARAHPSLLQDADASWRRRRSGGAVFVRDGDFDAMEPVVV